MAWLGWVPMEKSWAESERKVKHPADRTDRNSKVAPPIFPWFLAAGQPWRPLPVRGRVEMEREGRLSGILAQVPLSLVSVLIPWYQWCWSFSFLKFKGKIRNLASGVKAPHFLVRPCLMPACAWHQNVLCAIFRDADTRGLTPGHLFSLMTAACHKVLMKGGTGQTLQHF